MKSQIVFSVLRMTFPTKDKNIFFGGEIKTSVTGTYRSLGHFLLDRLKAKRDHVIMVNATIDEAYSQKYIYERVVRLAYVLQHLGVKQGDVIGICADSSIDHAVTLIAILAVGATAAPSNVTYNERELHHAFNLSKPKIVFCSSGSLSRVLRVANVNTFVKRVIVFDEQSTNKKAIILKDLENDENIVSFQDFESPRADKINDVALIVCSSGTTGLPKGVQLSQMNVLFLFDSQVDSNASQIFSSEVVTLSVIPWFHAYGCFVLLLSAVEDNTLVFLPKFDIESFLGTIQKYKVAIAFMVPPLMVFLAKHPSVDKYDLSSLKILLCGAAPLSKETEDAIKQRIGNLMIRQAYGLSESTLGTLIQSDTHCKSGSVGTIRPGLWAKVIDTETGVALGANQRGELCFKGPSIMKGYIGDMSSTRDIIKDGWLHTGDIGYYNDDFDFYIVDRIKELIKYKGYQVAPAEIEAILLTHPKLKDAAVIGKPDESVGELPLAFIVKYENCKLSAEEVIKFVADKVSPTKQLRGGVIFVDEIPKNQSGKILRRVLRDALKKPKSML